MRGGRSVFKGVNAQSKGAMALFLQYLNYGLKEIAFEGDKLEDFALIFNSGKKIICESKNYKQGIRHSDLKRIIEKIALHNQLEAADEILIVCNKCNKQVKKDLENIKYWGEYDKERVTKLGYNQKILPLLSKTKIWEISSSDSETLIFSLFAQLLNIWIPEEDLMRRINSLLIEKVYKGSEKGMIYSAKDFLEELKKNKKEIIENSGLYDDERVQLENQLKSIKKAIEDHKKPEWALNQLSSLTAQPNKMIYVLEKFKDKTNINLSDWDDLWKASVVSFYNTYLIDIFEKNLSTENNRKYALSFIDKVLINKLPTYRSEFLKVDISKLCEKIFDEGEDLFYEVFEISQKLLKINQEKLISNQNHQMDEWEHDEILKLFKKLYLKANTEQKKLIVKYIINNFNLIQDQGEYLFYTPQGAFDILREEFLENPEDSIRMYTSLFSNQYDAYYRHISEKLTFKGWDLMSGGISQAGDNYSMSDNHFVSQLIKPALNEMYKKDPKKAWEFVNEFCITTNKLNISREHPDFLNRASIEILIKEFINGNNKEQAFKILEKFIRMKGIPLKADLIFQEVKLAKDMTDEDKWRLLEVSFKAYSNLPINPFVEQITSDLASKGKEEAINAISNWMKNSKYVESSILGSDMVTDIAKLLENPNTFSKGKTILQAYLFSESFINKNNNWRSWDIAKLVSKIIIADPNEGITLLLKIANSKTLTLNQQIILTSSIENLSENSETKLMLIVFNKFVKTVLENLKTISNIQKKFNNRGSRESFVKSAEKLAEKNYFEEALWLIKIFIEDNDPPINGKNYDDDPKGDFNYHKKIVEGDDSLTINTVRGYCAWALQKFAVLRGRRYITQIIPLVERLAFDNNYYVRQQACVPLLDLARNRHTVIPDSDYERFISMKAAQDIEKLVFKMLEDKANQSLPAVMKSLGRIFSFIRNLNEQKALEVIQTFLDCKFPEQAKGKDIFSSRKREVSYDEVIEEIVPFFIYYSEFRQRAFSKIYYKKVFGESEWLKLNNYNPKKINGLLIDILVNAPAAVKAHFAWAFWRLPKENSSDFEKLFKISTKYLTILASNYDHWVYEKIYYFIEENIAQKFDECYSLWRLCLIKEKEFFESNIDINSENTWWPFHYNDKILMVVAEKKGSEEFLKWFNHLLKYPVQVYIAHDLTNLANYMKALPNNNPLVGENISLLIKRNSSFNDLFEEVN